MEISLLFRPVFLQQFQPSRGSQTSNCDRTRKYFSSVRGRLVRSVGATQTTGGEESLCAPSGSARIFSGPTEAEIGPARASRICPSEGGRRGGEEASLLPEHRGRQAVCLRHTSVICGQHMSARATAHQRLAGGRTQVGPHTNTGNQTFLSII